MEELILKILQKLKELEKTENEKEFFNNISSYMVALNKLLITYSGFDILEYEKELIFFKDYLELDFNKKQKPLIKSYLVLKKQNNKNSFSYELLFNLSDSLKKINGRLNGTYFGKEKLLISNKEFIKNILSLIKNIEENKKDLLIFINRDFKQIAENVKKR